MKTDWQLKKLGEVCSFENGDRGVNYPSKSHRTKSGIPFINAGHLTEKGIDMGSMDYISKERYDLLSGGKVRPGDILFCLRGSLGKAAIVNEISEGAIASSLIIVRAKSALTNKFLMLYFNSSLCSKMIKKYSNGAAQPNLSAKSLMNFQIPIPPIEEQRHIVKILDEVYEKTAKAKENTQKNLQNSKDLFESYLQTILSNEGSDWEQNKLKQVAEYFIGLTYSPKEVSTEGTVVLRSSNVQNNKLDFSDIVRVNRPVKESLIVKEGDILMCSRNGSKRLVGKVAMIHDLKERMTFGTFMTIIRSDYNPYLFWFFRSGIFRNQINGGENPMINQITRYMLDDISIKVPPIKKQDSIVTKLEELSTKALDLEEICQKKLSRLEELRRSILSQAFSGNL